MNNASTTTACDIRSIDTGTLLARVNTDGLILLYCRLTRRSYRLSLQDVEEAKQLALRNEKTALLIKQVAE